MKRAPNSADSPRVPPKIQYLVVSSPETSVESLSASPDNEDLHEETPERNMPRESMEPLDLSRKVISHQDQPPTVVEAAPEPYQNTVLEALRILLTSLNSKFYDDLLMRIKTEILNIGYLRETIPMRELSIAFKPCLLSVTKSAKIETKTESINLITFLFVLKTAILFVKYPGLNSFIQEIDDTISENSGVEKKVPVEKINAAIEIVMNTLWP